MDSRGCSLCSLHASLPELGGRNLCPHGSRFRPCVLGSRSTPGPTDLSSVACLLLAPSFSPVSPHPPSGFWSGPPLHCGSDGKASACNAGDSGSIPGLGRSPGGGNGYPLQYSSLESPMDRAWWATYSPWGRKELDMAEQLIHSSSLKARLNMYFIYILITLPQN